MTKLLDEFSCIASCVRRRVSGVIRWTSRCTRSISCWTSLGGSLSRISSQFCLYRRRSCIDCTRCLACEWESTRWDVGRLHLARLSRARSDPMSAEKGKASRLDFKLHLPLWTNLWLARSYLRHGWHAIPSSLVGRTCVALIVVIELELDYWFLRAGVLQGKRRNQGVINISFESAVGSELIKKQLGNDNANVFGEKTFSSIFLFWLMMIKL